MPTALYTTSLFGLALTPYLALRCIIDAVEGLFEIISFTFLLSYLFLFLLIVFIYKILSQLLHKQTVTQQTNRFLNFSDILFIEALFLILSSLIISPISFAFLIGPISRNIFIHLIIVYFVISFIEKRKTKSNYI